MTGIYKITSPIGKVYIGQSKNILNRFSSYKKKDCKRQKLLYRSFVKYGVSNHTFEVIEECKLSELNERERYWQEHYNVIGSNGLNLSLVNTKEKKFVHSKESKNKISKTHKGKKLSKNHIEAIRNSRRGKKLSVEHIEKLNKTSRKHYNYKKSKPILNTNNGIFYNTTREAAYSLNLNRNTLKGLLNGSAKYKNNTPLIYV
jgi:group I intron endonuclease